MLFSGVREKIVGEAAERPLGGPWNGATGFRRQRLLTGSDSDIAFHIGIYPMRQVSTFSRSMLALLAAAGWLGVTISVSAAHERTFTKACAEQDVKVITLIEDHGA